MRTRLLLLFSIAAVVTAMAGLVAHLSSPGRPVSASEETDREAIHYNGVTACGVERWAVKTGIDSMAGSVDTAHVVGTNIIHLRSLPAPASPPARSRIRPVETSVFQVNAILLRVKQEQDSDFHLVLSDTGGRTMIAEIPAPACVGTNSAFIHQLRYVRRTFTSRFHPTDAWQRGHWPVTVTGVGFFDFRHGQSGVAPNAIELHPVLAIKYGTGSSTPPPPSRPPPTAKPQPATGAFSVSAYVSPNPVHYGQYATLYARSIAGATCTASVLYSTGRPPRSFSGSQQTVGGSGLVSWQWHMESKGTGGTATVSCSLRGQTKSATASFAIA